MNDELTLDEYAALSEIVKMQRGSRPSACVARNTKRLIGLKYIVHEKSGKLVLTEKGRQTLFVKNCVDGWALCGTVDGVECVWGIYGQRLKRIN